MLIGSNMNDEIVHLDILKMINLKNAVKNEMSHSYEKERG